MISCSPQQFSKTTTGQIMLLVMAACVPAVLMSTYFFGIGTLLNIGLAAIFALLLESAVLKFRDKDIRLHLSDNSALVTAVLLGITMPPGSQWWLTLSGVFCAIVIAKHAFGGLGHNPFNPAMSGYVILLLFFPLAMTSWHIPVALSGDELFSPLSFDSLLSSIQLVFPTLAPDSASHASSFTDGMAMATPLIEQNLAGHSAIKTVLDADGGLGAILDRASETGWELVNTGFLVGGLFLMWKKVISWHIPVSIIGSILLLSLLFYADSGVSTNGSAYLHLFGTATMIGAFFIATDPVSAAASSKGKLLYGVIIGCGVYSIRVWGGYLDSIAFAVLIGNFCVPLIDHFCTREIRH
ncbi:MAG: RnfABCDGE type electron transport complex subunit D [Gammaproteobacteria bacterium]|nr:RnfABCDGE type electron transport complex subunit D [Gammaproteobacteria bacterium]